MIWPVIYCVKYRYLAFLLKIYLGTHFYFCKKFEICPSLPDIRDAEFVESEGDETGCTVDLLGKFRGSLTGARGEAQPKTILVHFVGLAENKQPFTDTMNVAKRCVIALVKWR